MDARIFIYLLYAYVCTAITAAGNCSDDMRQVLLVSMDGFRWDYTKKTDTPNFDLIAATGTKAPFINNTFITKTFPSHYTIVTGLYEESHGIIGNHMYDPVFNATFGMGTKESRWWNGGEPLWVTARKNGLKSATYFWPGSEAEIHGKRPNIWLSYNESIPFEDRVDTVMDWLTNQCTDFVTLYFNEPDTTGHKYGPDSPEIRSKVSEMDTLLGSIIQKLDNFNLTNTVDLIVTSDHGMTAVDFSNKLIDISTLVDMDNDIMFTVDSGPIMQIMPKGNMSSVLQSLQGSPNMQVYRKEDIPVHWHYGNNRRVMSLFAVAKEGWSIVTNGTIASTISEKGNHGYDNTLMTMKPMFYARGPHIRRNYTANVFKNVDIYTMVCHILNMKEAPNNGSLSRVRDFIISPSSEPNKGSISKPCPLFSVLIILFSIFQS